MNKDHECVTMPASSVITVTYHTSFDKYHYFPVPQFPKQQDCDNNYQGKKGTYEIGFQCMHASYLH